jgi:SlyX protein
MIEQRMIDFEIKISHQENAMESLQQLVYEQQKALEKMQVRINQLAKRLEGDADGRIEVGPGNEKPPHY